MYLENIYGPSFCLQGLWVSHREIWSKLLEALWSSIFSLTKVVLPDHLSLPTTKEAVIQKYLEQL